MTNKAASFLMLLFFFSTIIFFSINTVKAEQGVYDQKCAKCHSLKKPEIYTKKQWKHHVERMAERAGLTPSELKIIIDLNS